MLTVESISYSKIRGQRQFDIDIFDSDTQKGITIGLPLGKYDKSTIVNHLIRSQYTQDRVEAIINNHFLNISEWLDKKLAGEEVVFDDPEYTKFQEWRNISKKLADDIIEEINKMLN